MIWLLNSGPLRWLSSRWAPLNTNYKGSAILRNTQKISNQFALAPQSFIGGPSTTTLAWERPIHFPSLF